MTLDFALQTMDEFIQDAHIRKAFELVRLGRSFFITGKAGTGKTTLLRKIVKECRARGKNIAVTAPTGVAAKNAEGQTLHSMFGLPTAMFIPGRMSLKNYRLDSIRQKVITHLDILIIDEISMVRCDVLDMVDLTLQKFKKNKKPFGGIQVILFGDLFQLPPVVTEDDEELLYNHYDNSFFFAADVIKKQSFPVLELQEVYRQKDDEIFIGILNNIRDGRYLAADVTTLNKRLKPGYEPSEKESAVYLRTVRRKVWGHNSSKLEQLPGEPRTLWAIKDDGFPRSLYPTDEPLLLKVGAKVMLLRNDNDEKKYVNGTQGIITSFHNGNIRVKTDEGRLITLERKEWILYKYVYNEEKKIIEAVPDKSFRQYPLKLAWAVTIHKSQGMTFNKVVVDARKSFAPGQVYVALSRCRSLNGLVLTSRITKDDIKVSEEVVEYMKNVERIIPEETELQADLIERETFFYSDEGKTLTGIASDVCGEIEIPEGVEKVTEEAFRDNTNITSVICPASLREIGDWAFIGCENLHDIKLNDGLHSIGQEAFLGTALMSITLPSSLTEMGLTPFECKMEVDAGNEHYWADSDGVLYNQDALVLYPRKSEARTIEIPGVVTSVESYAFEECKAEEIIFPETIDRLNNDLFNGCTKLKTLTIMNEEPDDMVIDENAFRGFEVEECVLKVPFCSLREYKAYNRFRDFKHITAIEFVTGHFFKMLTDPVRSESKHFCLYERKFRCYVVMNADGFFLKMVGGGYYFLSEHISELRFGHIWVQNKKERLSSYDVSYSTDDLTGQPFGHFTENHTDGTLTYRDVKSGRSFKVKLETGKRI